MAIFKMIREKYVTETDLLNLLDYCDRQSCSTIADHLCCVNNMENIKNQFLYIQNCKGGNFNTRALHYVLSFDTRGWEQFMSLDKVNGCMMSFCFIYFKDHQHICFLHNKKGQRHFHIIVNPVALSNHKIFHCSKREYKAMCEDMAFMLGTTHGFAIQNISYITEEGNYRYGQETGGFLYQNRILPYENIKG